MRRCRATPLLNILYLKCFRMLYQCSLKNWRMTSSKDGRYYWWSPVSIPYRFSCGMVQGGNPPLGPVGNRDWIFLGLSSPKGWMERGQESLGFKMVKSTRDSRNCFSPWLTGPWRWNSHVIFWATVFKISQSPDPYKQTSSKALRECLSHAQCKPNWHPEYWFPEEI